MISIFCTQCTAHDIRFRTTSRQARNPKPLRFVFERIALKTNLDKLRIVSRFYVSIIKRLSQPKICYNSFLPDTLWEHTKIQNGMLWRRIDDTCLVTLSLTLPSKESVAQLMPSVILQTVSSQSGKFVGFVTLRLQIKRILYYSVLRIQIHSWQWKRTLSITHRSCDAGAPVV
jgi:hypothetical protein